MLDLSLCSLNDDDVEVVAQFLETNKTVEDVRLWGNKIGVRGAKAIATLISRNRTIFLLDLYNNDFENEGAECILEAVSLSNVCITFLNLNGNNLTLKFDFREKLKSITTRNQFKIPENVRRVALYLIIVRKSSNFNNMGNLAIFPKEIVKMIAIRIWQTRRDPIWINSK